jgi:ubiquinone/menaquinone biosynthesis C-methylase UbiE
MKVEADFWRSWWNEQARRSGSDYALNRRTSVRLELLEEKALQQFLEEVDPQPQDAILDAGCGSGRNISILSARVREIVGVDYSDQMLARAKEKIIAEGLSNARLLQADITKLQFAPDTFDKVICASVLQYLDDADCEQALKELVRVCKPGGKLVIHLKNGASLYGLSLKTVRLVARLFGKRMKPEHYRSRRWHESRLARQGAVPGNYDGFGIFTFVPLPAAVVGRLLDFELRLRLPRFFKKLAVNYQLTVQVNKPVSPQGS